MPPAGGWRAELEGKKGIRTPVLDPHHVYGMTNVITNKNIFMVTHERKIIPQGMSFILPHPLVNEFSIFIVFSVRDRGPSAIIF